VADVVSDIQQDNGIKDPECPEQRDVSAAPNIPRLIRRTWEPIREAAKAMVTVNATETRRNKKVKPKLDGMGQCFTSFFI